MRSLLTFISFLFIFLLISAVSKVSALTLESCLDQCGSVSDDINITNIKSADFNLQNNTFQLSVTFNSESAPRSICTSLEQMPLIKAESTPIMCKKISIPGDENNDINTQTNFTLDSLTAGKYTVRFWNESGRTVTKQPIWALGEQSSIIVNDINGTPLPTPSPTPISGEDCIGLYQTFMYAGTCCNPNSDQNGIDGKPFCEGYTCQQLPSNLLDSQNENIVCKEQGGWVQPISYRQNSDEDIQKAIKQATQACGKAGSICCEPRVAPPPKVDNRFVNLILDPLQNWLMDLVGIESMTNQIESDINQATGGKLCTETGTQAKITLLNGQKELAANYIVGDKEKGEDSQYSVLKPTISYQEECLANNGGEKCYDLPSIPRYKAERLDQQQVESCRCESENTIENKQFKQDAAIPREKNPDVLMKQICGIRQDCIKCIEVEGNYWQDWLNDGKGACVNEQNAINNLRDRLDQDSSQTRNIQNDEIALSGKPSVLAGNADVDTYIKGCNTLNDTSVGGWSASHLCKACRISGGFWGVWGCYSEFVDVGFITNLCKPLEDNTEEYGKCINCTSQGKMWTAIGCIDFNLGGIIQEEIFGWGLGLAGTAALLCIIYSSFILQTSANNPEKINQAQEMMTSCIAGFIVIIFSVFILNVIGVDILRIPGFSRSPASGAESAEVTEAPSSVASAPTPTPTNTPSPTPTISNRGTAKAGAILYQSGNQFSLSEGQAVILTALSTDGRYIEVETSPQIGWVSIDSLNYNKNLILPSKDISFPIPTPTLPLPISTPTSTPTPIPTRNPSLGQYDCDTSGPFEDEVYLYDELEYANSGACLRLTVGDYSNTRDISNNSTTGWSLTWGKCKSNFDDCISSLKVGPNVEVTLFADPDFTGCNLTTRNGINNLSQVGTSCTGRNFLTDKISSIKVVKQ